MQADELDVGDLFRIADQFHDSALLHYAHACGLFEATTEPLDAQALARHMKWVPRKATIFLNALAAIGLLSKDDEGRYRNAPVVDRSLVKSKPGYMGGVIEHQRLQWDTWTRLEDVLTTRDTLKWQQEQRLRDDPEANNAFHQAMRNLARANLPAFLSLPLPNGRKHVIDMAGSHGTYLAALAQQNLGFTGEVWDLPGAEPHALQTLREYHCADRCVFRAKDITRAESYTGVHADIVMLNDCLHYFEPDTVREILTRARGVLNAQGTLLLATQWLHEDGIAPAPAAGFSMHMMLNTAHGGLHSTPWIAELMTGLGFAVSQLPLDPTGRYVILHGRLGSGSSSTLA